MQCKWRLRVVNEQVTSNGRCAKSVCLKKGGGECCKRENKMGPRRRHALVTARTTINGTRTTRTGWERLKKDGRWQKSIDPSIRLLSFLRRIVGYTYDHVATRENGKHVNVTGPRECERSIVDGRARKTSSLPFVPFLFSPRSLRFSLSFRSHSVLRRRGPILSEM